MSGRNANTIGLRPYLPTDAGRLAEIFRAGIEELTGDDYSEAQQEAWSARADDEAAFAAKLAGGLTLIATEDGVPVGFATLKDNSSIDMLYVQPEFAGRGVARALCDALEKLALARGAASLEVDASDTARGFFEKRGYGARQRNTVSLGDEWLGNTTMRKMLKPAENDA